MELKNLLHGKDQFMKGLKIRGVKIRGESNSKFTVKSSISKKAFIEYFYNVVSVNKRRNFLTGMDLDPQTPLTTL